MTMRRAEAEWYWKGVIATLKQRGLLRQYRKGEDGSREQVVPQASYLSTDEWICFILDMQRLAGIPREALLERALWKQIRATLGGRDTTVVDGAGLGVLIAREPIERTRSRLARRVMVEPDHVPEGRYTALLGQSRSGEVVLDLAGGERAVLIGGSTGKGKTTAMLSVILQLVHKNGPDALQLAIVDLKRLDFTALRDLPHLVKPVATTEEDAVELVKWCREEMERRFDVMDAAQVTLWDRMAELEQFPLLAVVVDEAADFARSEVMSDLIELARKSRAAGIALMLATQRPDAEVLSRQVKANLQTRMAFAVADRYESDIILGRTGAERLKHVGRCITNAGGEWREVQAAYIPEAALGEWIENVGQAKPILSEIERELVRYAVEGLEGAFITDRLYEAQKAGRLATDDRLSKYAIEKLAKAWERRSWLTEPTRNEHGHKVGRQVTPELARIAIPGHTTSHTTAQGSTPSHTIHTTTPRSDSQGGGEGPLPPFLEQRQAAQKWRNNR